MTRIPVNGGGEVAMKVGTASLILSPAHGGEGTSTHRLRLRNRHRRHVIQPWRLDVGDKKGQDLILSVII